MAFWTISWLPWLMKRSNEVIHILITLAHILHFQIQLLLNRVQKIYTMHLSSYSSTTIPSELNTLHTHFFASNFLGSFSKGVVFSRKSLAARSCKVPPHFNPRACNSDFNLSIPRTYQYSSGDRKDKHGKK